MTVTQTFTIACPAHGEQEVVSTLDGAPSMLGYGTDPDVEVLGCGCQVGWSPLDGAPWVRDSEGRRVNVPRGWEM